MEDKIEPGDMVVLLPFTTSWYGTKEESLYSFPDKMNLGDPVNCTWKGEPALVLEVAYKDRMFPKACILTPSGVGWTYEDYLEKMW